METATGDTYSTKITAVLTQNLTPGAFTNEGAYTVAGGPGRFKGATGAGTLLSAGVDAGQTGTLDSLEMTGTINLA